MFDSLPQARDYYLNSTGDKERCDKWSFHFLSRRCQGSTSEMSTRAKQTSLQNWKTRMDKNSPKIGLQFHWNLVFNVNVQ